MRRCLGFTSVRSCLVTFGTSRSRLTRYSATGPKGSEVGFFFYAGHGLQVGLPELSGAYDAKAEGAEALDFEMVRVFGPRANAAMMRSISLASRTLIALTSSQPKAPLTGLLAGSRRTVAAQVTSGAIGQNR